MFERWGFARVITPAFEYEDVLALGLGSAGRDGGHPLRRAELGPGGGAAPGHHPADRPPHRHPLPRRGRARCACATRARWCAWISGARSQRELIQAGVELAGVAGPRGDAEVIALGAAALAAAGLRRGRTIDLGHLGLAREVLDALGLPDDALRAGARPHRQARSGRPGRGAAPGRGAPRAVVEFAALLPELSGPPARPGRRPRRRRPPAGIRRALDELAERAWPSWRAPARPPRLHVDLGEVRGFDYYTGMRVQGFVPGAAEPVLQGGRYDGLLARYGRPCPAVGFAIDVEATAGALETGRRARRRGSADGDERRRRRAC